MMRNVLGLFRQLRKLTSMLILLIVDAVCYLRLCLHPNPALAAENLFLRKQQALDEERQGKPRRGHPRDSTSEGFALLLVRLALGITHCETRDVYTLASSGLSPVLVLQIQAGSTCSAQGLANTHSSHGSRAPHLGARADHQRAAAQTRPSSITKNGTQVHAKPLHG